MDEDIVKLLNHEIRNAIQGIKAEQKSLYRAMNWMESSLRLMDEHIMRLEKAISEE